MKAKIDIKNPKFTLKPKIDKKYPNYEIKLTSKLTSNYIKSHN